MVKVTSQGGPEQNDAFKTWKDYYIHEPTAAVPAQNLPQIKPLAPEVLGVVNPYA